MKVAIRMARALRKAKPASITRGVCEGSARNGLTFSYKNGDRVEVYPDKGHVLRADLHKKTKHRRARG